MRELQRALLPNSQADYACVSECGMCATLSVDMHVFCKVSYGSVVLVPNPEQQHVEASRSEAPAGRRGRNPLRLGSTRWKAPVQSGLSGHPFETSIKISNTTCRSSSCIHGQ